MERILYSKFSNERKKEYNIRTDICEKETGEKYVRKTWDNPLAKGHIDNTRMAYEKLAELFCESGLSVNRLTERGRYLQFEFLQGKSMEQILDENQLQDLFWQLLKEYTNKIRDVYGRQPFQVSPAFEKFFGKLDLPDGLMGSTYMDIDLIFPNIIVNENGWNVIDYEWTFPFMIPVNYLIYRALFFYKYRNGVDTMPYPLDRLYEEMGISKKEIQIYQKMEEAFHTSVFSSQKTTGDLVVQYEKKQTIDKAEMLTGNYCQVQITDYPAEDKFQRLIFMNRGAFEMHLPFRQDSQKIEIQFEIQNSAFLVQSIQGMTETGEKIDLSVEFSNVVFSNGKVVLNQEQYPQFLIQMPDEPIIEIEIHIQISCIQKEDMQAIAGAIHDAQDETIAVRKLYQDEIVSMKNSTSWKSTAWIRAMGSLLKRQK